MDPSKYQWHRLEINPQAASRLEKGEVVELWVQDQGVCLAKYQGKLFAFAQKCPHAGAPFSMGEVDRKGRVICGQHGYRFDIRTGVNTSGEGYQMSCWPVERRTEGLFIGLVRPIGEN